LPRVAVVANPSLATEDDKLQAAPFGPNAVTAADVNGDGAPDLIVDNSFGGTLSVLLNAGGGSFTPHVSSPRPSLPSTQQIQSHPQAVVAADVNGDGRLDLVSVNEFIGTVAVMVGNGDGTFGKPASMPVGSFPNSVRVAYLNDDRTPDLVTSNGSGTTVS